VARFFRGGDFLLTGGKAAPLKRRATVKRATIKEARYELAPPKSIIPEIF
jgi:hypothetical protein